jgi:hypothetical protein
MESTSLPQWLRGIWERELIRDSRGRSPSRTLDFILIRGLRGRAPSLVVFFNGGDFFFGGAAFGEDFAATEEVGHGVTADGPGLLGGHDGGEFLRIHAGRAEVGVEFQHHLVLPDVVRAGRVES